MVPPVQDTPRRPRGTLDEQEIIDEAVALICADGLDAFSMRKLAAAVGVTPMAIYLRFENKDALLAAVAEHMLGRFRTPAIEGPWEDRVVAFAEAIRSHLNGARPVLALVGDRHHLGTAMADATEVGLTLMEEAGYEGVAAVAAFRSVFWHAVGAAMVAETIAADPVAVLRQATPAPAEPDRRHQRLHALLEHFDVPDADEIFRTSTRALAVGLAAAARGARS